MHRNNRPSAGSPIDPRVQQEMHQLGLAVVKMRLAAALQQGKERVPVQRPGVLGEAPTCNQVVEWVSYKEAEKERKERRLQISTLVFAAVGAVAAVIAVVLPLFTSSH